MNWETLFKWWGRLFCIIFSIMFIEFLFRTIRDYEINLGLIPYIGYTFIVYYSWVIPLAYFSFRKRKRT
jgi:hypothetical protein